MCQLTVELLVEMNGLSAIEVIEVLVVVVVLVECEAGLVTFINSDRLFKWVRRNRP